MNKWVRIQLLGLYKTPRVFHFWIIIILMVLISIIYYKWQDWFPWIWRYFIFEYNNNLIGILFILIPYSCAAIFFWWRGPMIVWTTSVLVLLPLLPHYYGSMLLLVRNIGFILVPLAIVITLAMELDWRKKQKEIAVERERQRQVFTLQIIKAQEDERRSIAQEIHDDTIQQLVALASCAQNTLLNIDEIELDAVKPEVERMRDIAVEITEDLRRTTLDLRPTILDNFGLVPALRWLVGRLNKETNIVVSIDVTGEIRQLRPEVEVNIFRIVQEVLNNIKKHSNARKALVFLEFNLNNIKLNVEDNGRGFILNSKTTSAFISQGKLGIIGMRQRAESIGSTLNIKPRVGKGTSVSMEVPIY